MAEAAPNIRSTEARSAVIHPSAAVSSLAAIGAPGEWRDKDTQHPAVVCEDATIREFVTVHAGCERITVIGPRTLLMAHSHIGHDAIIGEDCEVSSGAVVGGCCSIGDRVRIGLNATIRPKVRVGAGARIGMGAVVTKDVPAGETWAGNPAKRLGPRFGVA